jgi:hypothetical protein
MSWKSCVGLSLSVAVCLAASATSPAAACGSGKLIFEDKLATVPSWASGSDKSAGPNGLTITENLANTTWFSGPPDGYASAELCVTVSAQGPESVDATAGVLFYFFNSENYYRAAVSNIAGTFLVERRQAGQWVPIIPFASSPVIRKGPTAENELSIRLSGTHALVSVNDKPVGEFDAAVAFINDKRQSYFDLSWGSYPSDKPAFTFLFKDMQIREAP